MKLQSFLAAQILGVLALATVYGQPTKSIPAPSLQFTWANRDGLKSLDDVKGKVIVLDFWTTWCAPSVAAFGNKRSLAEYYQGTSVEVIGVTSLQGKITGLDSVDANASLAPKKELALMKDYIKAKNITWTVAMSKDSVFNTNFGVSSLPYITIIAPDGTIRYNGLLPSTPIKEKIDSILAEFNLPLPTNQNVASSAKDANRPKNLVSAENQPRSIEVGEMMETPE